MYADVGRRAPANPLGALTDFRTARDRLFATHPDSPIPFRPRASFRGLPYWSCDAALRFEVTVDAGVELMRLELPMSRDEAGGGVFLPFYDPVWSVRWPP